MNENFLIPNQASLYNIKSIYNTMIEKLSEGGFENLIINPKVDETVLDSSNTLKKIAWDFSNMPVTPLTNIFNFNDPNSRMEQNIAPKLTENVFTIIIDFKTTDNIDLSLRGQSIGPNVYRPYIQDINFSDPNDYVPNLLKTLEPKLNEFGHPVRHRVAFNFSASHLISGFEAILGFSRSPSAVTDPVVQFYNIVVVKGLLAVNLDKQQGFFTDYVRYNNSGFFEASMDEGNSYHRILTTRQEDIDEFVNILISSGIIYSKSECDLMFLRKDVPDVAHRLITFLEGLRAGEDINLDEAAKLILDGGNIVVNNAQVTGTPDQFFSLMVKRGDERDVGIRYNETIDRWQFTHDGVDWKIFGEGIGEGSDISSSFELEYFAEILDKTPFKFGYYDLFDEVNQSDSVINQNLNYSGDDTLYKVEDYPAGPWYITTKNIWNPDHVGNSYSFFVHALTNKDENAGLNISYSLVGSGLNDPLLPNDPAWIPINMNDVISPTSNIDEFYLKFEFQDDSVEFHSFGVFYGTWNTSTTTYTRMREYFTSSGTNQTITVPNGADYTVGAKALELYLNRVRQILDIDYTEVDKHTVQMLVPVNSGDVIEFYEKFGFADMSTTNADLISDNTDAIDNHVGDLTNPHGVTLSQVGGASLSHQHVSADITDLVSTIQANAGGLGTGQTWHDETTNRDDSTTYQNTSGEAIQLLTDFSSPGTLEMSDDNVIWISIPQNGIIIPNNYFYRAGTAAGVVSWYELY